MPEVTANTLDALKTIFEPGAVVELRAFKDGKTISGYFNNHEALAEKAGELDECGHAVYVTLNEVNPALLARAANRTRPVYREPTTSDSDILRRRWLPLDFDPKRPSGVSATNEEKEAAERRMVEVREYLERQDWPAPVAGDSGNGYHLLYPVDLTNSGESLELVKGVLEALAFKFSDEAVDVDTSVHNAARIWKLYGTTARKGDDTPSRPHRRSAVLGVPEALQAVDRELLEVAARSKPIPPRDERRFDAGRNGYKDFDLDTWIPERGVPVKREGPWGQSGYRWILEACPWNGHTDNAAFIVQGAGGWIAAGCQHNSCQGMGWRELREHFEPGAYERNGHPARGSIGEKLEDPTGPPISAPWPALKDEALYGLAGDIVRAADPHTEADPVAVLVSFLAALGNAVGRGAHIRVGPDRHFLKLYLGLVGETSKGRKGTSWGPVRELMSEADEAWALGRVLNGLSSGEGLIYAVRDRVMGLDKEGNEKVVDPGVEDKRLQVVESELANVLKVMSREGNTLSPVVRQGWDDGRLQVLTKNSPIKATGAHISIVGHITKDELLRHLTETEAANGFANRFLWLMVRRSKQLPRGGEWWRVDKKPLVGRITDVLEFGLEDTEVKWGESAGALWDEIYGPLSEGKPGLFGSVIGRAEAQVLRLATLYAVLDKSRYIAEEHLAGALALWDYAEASARYIFGDATGDTVADQITEALGGAGANGMSRTEIRDYFGRNKKADRINQALALLLKAGRVRQEQKDTGGRPVEMWFSK